MRRCDLAGPLALAGWLAMAGSACAFQCPAPQPLSRPGVLKESDAALSELTAMLASGDAENQERVAIDDLRRRYPGIENAEIANYLMTAYCPLVGRLSGLSDAEKQARIDTFMSRSQQMIRAGK
jgi:hypothetical protein